MNSPSKGPFSQTYWRCFIWISGFGGAVWGLDLLLVAVAAWLLLEREQYLDDGDVAIHIRKMIA